MAETVAPPPPGFVLAEAPQLPAPPEGFELERPQQSRIAQGIGDAFMAGVQSSASGLMYRGKLPDIVLDPHNAKWYEKAVAAIGQMGADLPEMIVGGGLGTVGGTAVGGPVGGILGGGAGAFATPAAIRESLMQAYSKGEVQSSGDFLNRAAIVLKQTAKEGVVGAATFGVGGAVARVTGKALAPAIGETITVPSARMAIGTAQTAAEIGTMVVTPAALEGRLPEPEDFVNAAIVVGFAKGAIGAGNAGVNAVRARLHDIYAKTGVRPEQVVADAKNDPKIAEELNTKVLSVDEFAAKAGEEIGGVSHLRGIVESLQKTYIEKGEQAGRAMLDMKAESAPEFSNFANEVQTKGFVDDLHAELSRRATEFAAMRSGDIPRAYRPAAEAELLANALPEAPKVADIIANPIGTVTEGKQPNHINYRYVDAPEDVLTLRARIAEVMKTEIEQQRGKESWDQTQVKAERVIKDRLAGMSDAQKAELGKMSFSDLAAQSMAVEAMAQKAAYDARAAAAEIAAKGTEATAAEHAKLAEAIETSALLHQIDQGNGAEIARALTSRKAARQRAVLADGMTDLMAKYGADPQVLARMVLGLHTTAEITRFAKDATKATRWEKVVEAWKAGILSGPVTHMANLIGNSTFVVMRPVVDLTAAAIGKLTGAEERVVAAEPFGRLFGNLQGAKDAIKYAGEALRMAYEEGAFNKAAFGDRIGPMRSVLREIAIGTAEGPQKAEQFRPAIEGVKGDVIRLPFRGLQIADAFFKTMNERGESYALATRQAVKEGLNMQTREFRERVVELVQNPTVEMQIASSHAGLRYTFNLPLGEIGQNVSSLVKAAHLQMFVPFVRTPGNILKELARMTPLSPAVSEWRADWKAGGAARQKAVAEVMTGTAIMAVVASYALDSQITGQGNPDPKKRATDLAAGKQPYSWKVGDTYYNYQRVQPVGTLMGLAADMAEIWDHLTDEEQDKVPKMVAVAFANAVTNQTFLQGITAIVNAMSDPKRFGPRLAQQMAGSVVPNVIGQPTAMSDPYVREVNSVLEAIRARIPGLREDLMAKPDVFGAPIQTKTRLGGISPVTETTVSKDKVRLEASRLGVSATPAPKRIHIGRGTGKLGEVEITPEQRNKFTEASGQMAHAVLEPIVNAPTWEALPQPVQQKIFQRAFRIARQRAAISVFTPEQRAGLAESIAEDVQESMSK